MQTLFANFSAAPLFPVAELENIVLYRICENCEFTGCAFWKPAFHALLP